MKTFFLSLQNSKPKYLQIYQAIRAKIESGELPAHGKLPSIRSLAETLQVSRNTTLLAYEQLAVEGYVDSKPKRGYFVANVLPVDVQPPLTHAAVPKAENTQTITIDFRTGIVDQHAFPLKAWRKCANQVLREEEMIFGYGTPQGDLRLRQNLAKYLCHSRGLSTVPEAIVIGSSTQQLLMYLTILLKRDYHAIALENPGYDGAREVFELQGFQPIPIHITEKGLSVNALEKSPAKLVYITPSHQFPTGVTMPIAERQRLLTWASDCNGYIIEDDYDSEFRYKQQPIPALASLHPDAPVIYVSTFSKAFLPSIRISYMVLPPTLLAAYHQQLKILEQTASSLHQRTMAYFMEEGYWDSHIRRMRNVYKNKMQTLVEALETNFGQKIDIIGTQSGMYVLIHVKFAKDEHTLVKKALAYGIKVYPASPYFAGEAPKTPYIQLGFSNLSIEQIKTGVALLKIAWS